jgi:hypothetical protein
VPEITACRSTPEALAQAQLAVDLVPAVADHEQRLGLTEHDPAVAAEAGQTGRVDHLAVDQGAIEVEEQRARRGRHGPAH